MKLCYKKEINYGIFSNYLYFFLVNLFKALTPIAAYGIVFTVVIGILATIPIFSTMERDKAKKAFSCIPVKSIVAFYIFFIILSAAVPSESQMTKIIGGGVVWKIGNNEEVQKLPKNVAQAANRFLSNVDKEEKQQ